MAWNDVSSGNNTEKVDIEYIKLTPNNPVKIRILDTEPYSRWTHWLQKQSRTLTCGGRDCPICAVSKAQKANGETPQYSTTKRHIVHIWNYATNRVEFFEAGNTVFAQLGNYHRLLGSITEADITVIRSGTGKQTTYSFMPDTKAPISQHILTEYNNIKVDFEQRYTPPNAEDIKKLMSGMSFDEVYSSQAETPTPQANQEQETVSFVV